MVAGRGAASGHRRPRTTPRRTAPRSRSSAGSPSTRRPGSARAAARCRCRSSRSRRRRCGTTPRGPVIRTGICICRSTPGCSPPGQWRGLHTVGVRDSLGGDQRDRARRGDDRPAVPGGARRARLHPGRGGGDRAARAVRGRVQRAGGADRPQHRPLRSGMDRGAPRRDARAGAAPGVGRAGVGRRPPGQGHPAARRRADRPVAERAAPTSATATTTSPVELAPTPVGALDRDAAVEVVLARLGAGRSAWNAADIRGEVEQLHRRRRASSPTRRSVSSWPRTSPPAPLERCVPLLDRARACPNTSAR